MQIIEPRFKCIDMLEQDTFSFVTSHHRFLLFRIYVSSCYIQLRG